MKTFLFGLTLIASFTSFANTDVSKLAVLSSKYDLRTIVSNAFGTNIEYLEYAQDDMNLNVYHDSRSCHKVSLEELELNGKPRLVVTKIKRDLSCDI